MKTKVRAKGARAETPVRRAAKGRHADAPSHPAKRGHARAVKASAASHSARTAPLITRTELRRAVVELASTLAPADVTDLLAEEAMLRARAASLTGAPGDVFRTQLELALGCLHDHVSGRCPQIPYYTISLLTAAVAYLADDLDIIPDFLPDRGTMDDALVLAMVCTLAESGLRRYCTWKDIEPNAALGLVPSRSRSARGTRVTR